MTVVVARAGDGLARWSLFAAMIAAAGLPIYIHAPKAYVDQYGIGLAALGGVLGLLRAFDVVQDPILGWLAERGRARQGLWVAVAGGVMALSMLGLFAVTPPVAPLWWFAITLAGLFSAFSYLTIVFYAHGIAKAATLGPTGHLRLAGWREAGALLGVCVAAVALAGFGNAFAAFAVGFAGLVALAVWAMRGEWRGELRLPPAGLAVFRPALADPVARRLLLLSLLNGAPVAVTSTLFLFFVESRLGAVGAEGPLLLLFFLSAALSTLVWSRWATRFGAKPVLLAGMGLAVVAFLWAALLGAGDTLAFAVICAASGAALGADMVLLPAIFARRMAGLAQGGEAAAFGLWSFVSKASLALAAVTLLPGLQAMGFVPGAANDDAALWGLTVLYALLPCALKLLAIGLLAVTPVPEG